MYVVVVEFEIAAEHTESFRDAILQQASNSLAREDACQQFDVCFDGEDLSKCFLYEKYDDRAAFEGHLQSDHFKQFDSLVSSWLKSKTVQTWTQMTSSNENSK